MLLEELFESIDEENDRLLSEAARPIWRRKGNTVVRGYRCTSGKKAGRIVSSAATCGGKTDLKKKQRLKKTIMQKGARMQRKANRTKKNNPISKRLQKMNKATRR